MSKNLNLNSFMLGATVGAVSALIGATVYSIRTIKRVQQLHEINSLQHSEFAKRVKLDAEKDEQLRQAIAKLDQPVVATQPHVEDFMARS